MGALVDFLREYQNSTKIEINLPEDIGRRYTVDACLKSTEGKQVYLVRRNKDGKKCILKFLASTSKENTEEEYLLSQQLHHPGLVAAMEYVKDSQGSYLIREYIDGCTVAELVEMTTQGRLTDRETVTIAIQLCEVLQYLHSQKPPIIHRDIKPENIIVTKNGTCKLIDFGISRRFRNEQERDTVFLGTTATAPPEQYGFKQTDARSDIYSMGMLMCYMVTGSYELTELKQYAMPGYLRHCIIKCTQFSPGDRYSSAKQLKVHLKKYELLHTKIRIDKVLRLGMLMLITALGSAFLTWNLMSQKLMRQDSNNGQNASFELISADKQTMAANSSNPAYTNSTDKAVTDLTPGAEQSLADPQAASQQIAIPKDETGYTDETPYHFISSLIEAAAREQLGKSDTDIIYYGDLKRITELYLCGKQSYRNWDDHFVYGKNQYMRGEEYADDTLYSTRGEISSLNDIGHMKNLQLLALYNQNISDLTPLKNLEFLTDLGLGNNSIRDVSALEGLIHLKRLDLSGNLITDQELELIAKIPYLESLDLGDTKVTSLKKIEELPLIYLSVYGDRMEAFEGLEKMTSLEHLISNGVNQGINLEGMKKIAGLSSLRELNIMGSDDFDVSLLSELTNLRILDLCSCNVRSLEGLELLNLEELRADGISQLSLTGIEKNVRLSRLSLRDSGVLDFTPLKKLEYLQYFNGNSQQAERIKNQLGDVSFKVNVQTYY